MTRGSTHEWRLQDPPVGTDRNCGGIVEWTWTIVTQKTGYNGYVMEKPGLMRHSRGQWEVSAMHIQDAQK